MPAPASCEGGQVLIDALLNRDPGAPDTTSFAFSLPAAGEVCVYFESPGSADGEPSSAARVELDDDLLLAPREFRHHSVVHERRADASAGPHALRVTRASSPSSDLRVIVRFASDETDAIRRQAREVATLEHEGCNELNRTLEVMQPEDRAELLDSFFALGLQPGRMIIDDSVWGTPLRLTPLPEEDLGLGGSASPEATALAWLERHADAFRLTDPEIEPYALSAQALPLDSHRVELRARWRGLEIQGFALTVLIDFDGFVRSVHGEVVPRVATVSEPVVPADEAIAIAEAATGAEVLDEPELEILDLAPIQHRPATTLAWSMLAADTVVRVDALDGEVLETRGPFQAATYQLAQEQTQSWDTTPDEPGGVVDLSLTMRFDSSMTYRETALCSADEGCSELLPIVSATDQFYRSLGRSGWSDGGNGLSGVDAISADETYRVVYDRPNVGRASASFARVAIGETNSNLHLVDHASDEVLTNSRSSRPSCFRATGSART